MNENKIINLMEIDSIEIISLQDNYVDLNRKDNTDKLVRAQAVRNGKICVNIAAEHGLSVVVKTVIGREEKKILFDFGYSKTGAADNAEMLNEDLRSIECCVLSHGHPDHFGGLEKLVSKIGKKSIDLILHPDALKTNRFRKQPGYGKIHYPCIEEGMLKRTGVKIIKSNGPLEIQKGRLLFLGEIPRFNGFEGRPANYYYEENREEREDLLKDDSAIVSCIKGKGLVIITGCAHSGIINTIEYAKKITKVTEIYVVMGGFHLSAADAEIIELTVDALKKINPKIIVPCHCTGREAILEIERKMPNNFLLNMVGTKFIF